MRRAIPFAALLLVAGSVLARQEGSRPLSGFSSQEAQAEQKWEQKFRAIPSVDNLRESMKLLSAHPHHVGSPYDKQDGEWLAAKFKEWG
jgi:N-acetylated-alpha-linked acidic dipeptidase